MSRITAIASLKEATNTKLPKLLEDYPIKDKYVDEKPLANQLLKLSMQNDSQVALLETAEEADEEAINVVRAYKEAVFRAQAHLDSIRIHNHELMPGGKDSEFFHQNEKQLEDQSYFISYRIREEISYHVKNDDATRLEQLLKRCQSSKDILDVYFSALRMAATGSIHCLTYLLQSGWACTTAPGRSSNKIALHFAIERGFSEGVNALLRAKNFKGYHDPADQLLYGKYPNRPIDKLSLVAEKNPKRAFEIKKIIIAVLQDKTCKSPLTTEEQVLEINVLLAKEQAHLNILGLIKKDDVVRLEDLLKRYDKAATDFYSYALRMAAAHNAMRCLTYVIDSKRASLTEPGPISGKIALYFAIKNGHLSSANTLLRAKNKAGHHEPASQLLHGKDPNRPIDMLTILAENNEEKAEPIKRCILAVLQSDEGQGELTSQRQINKIKQILAVPESCNSGRTLMIYT